MLTSFPFLAIIGALLGFLAALGIGGGTLLILWLTQIINMEASSARTINLLFFIAASGGASLIRLRNQTVPWKRILPAIISGCISALAFSQIALCVNTDILKKLFACLLLITGVRELFYRDKKAK